MATVGWNQYPLGRSMLDPENHQCLLETHLPTLLIYHQKRRFTWEKLRFHGDIMIFFGGKPPGEWLVSGDLASFWLVPRKFNSDFVPFLWCHSNKAFRTVVFPQMMSVGWAKNETLTGVTSQKKQQIAELLNQLKYWMQAPLCNQAQSGSFLGDESHLFWTNIQAVATYTFDVYIAIHKTLVTVFHY